MKNKLILDDQLLAMIQVADDETVGEALRIYLENIIDGKRPDWDDDSVNLLMMFFSFKTERGNGEEQG